MQRAWLERRLRDLQHRLDKAREELKIMDEQLAAISEDASEARIRALVSETPMANREYVEAKRHADAAERSRSALLATINDLMAKRDELLERLVVESK
ncbi:MAG: hypothetical protein M1131_02290 [Actinobacteria bacterium]|nr:hypothetical protein [Actinomycetota bacterium]MCL6095530.1 hypothetical protein [Actinomycetota bacterium]